MQRKLQIQYCQKVLLIAFNDATTQSQLMEYIETIFQGSITGKFKLIHVQTGKPFEVEKDIRELNLIFYQVELIEHV